MCKLRNFGTSIFVVSVLAGCGGSGGDSSEVANNSPSIVIVTDTGSEQPSEVVQPDMSLQNPDEQINDQSEVSGNVDENAETETDQSVDIEDSNGMPTDTSADSGSQESDADSTDQIVEPAPILIPNGQIDATGSPLLVPLPVPEMIAIESGCYDIGSPDDEPLRSTTEGPRLNVCVSEFSLGRHEVTFAQYDAFAMATGRDLPDSNGFGRDDRPVINVVWEDAIDYVAWLSEKTGRSFRLPTEAEWEYAARAGSDTPFHTGQTITSALANFNDVVSYNGSAINGGLQQTLPVGSFAANAFGLHDMHGNVQEWTCSTFVGDYQSTETPQICDSSTDGFVYRMVRGGSWKSIARNVRSARRNSLPINLVSNGTGFRVLEQ